VVIDLDTHGTLPPDWRLPGIVDGSDVLAQICEWAGQLWPTTFTVRTPLGGWHLVFLAAGHTIRNSAGRIGPLIDVRGQGGYVLGAGSVLDERAYPKNPQAAAIVKGGRAYQVINDTGPAPLPKWLATLAKPPQAAPAASAGGHASAATAGGRMHGLAATVRAGTPGDRNGPLFWASCRAAEMITAGQIDRLTAEDALIGAALEAGLRGGEREARATFASAMRAVSGGGQ
jgi:hypothetical protein